MKVDTLLAANKRLFRRLFGEDSVAEKMLGRYFSPILRRVNQRKQVGNGVIFWSGNPAARTLGIYTIGGCDANAVFACESPIRRHLSGTCCIVKRKKYAASASSTILLQTARQLPAEETQAVIQNMNVVPDYFTSDIFEPEFTLRSERESRTFPKDVVILSLMPDVVRTLYRHKRHDIYVDPGGWWLNQKMDSVLQDLSAITWFQREFEKVGRISIDQSMANLREIIRCIREKIDPPILVFNGLIVEPGDHTYNYQLLHDPEVIRRRRYNIALKELSRELDFSVVDIDRVLKGVGIHGQVDFAHWTKAQFRPIAEEIVRILVGRGVFAKS